MNLCEQNERIQSPSPWGGWVGPKLLKLRAKPLAAMAVSEADQKRFWAKVAIKGPDECWEWKAALTPKGYGVFHVCGLNHAAHRVSVSISGRAVSASEVVDHQCRNPKCVNPNHLRVVTHKVNSIENSQSLSAANSKKTHCLRGHEFTAENTYLRARRNGFMRICKTCRNAAKRHYRALRNKSK